ncbi:hypothetical protein [Kitasatospora griseola]|uniref:hypothetical protein n=1 Tax=Kitasatospora griseola TaxID=2064 RepID=UPI000695F4F4|nr:hypothetical protein [Kitasatospora griseola]
MTERTPTGRGGGRPVTAAGEADAGLRQLEGYLYWQDQNRQARRAAQEFADLLPWLTAAQRLDLENHLAHTQLQAARRGLEQFREHRERLREQYGARYHRLRVRCLLAVLLATAVCTTVLLAVVRY